MKSRWFLRKITIRLKKIFTTEDPYNKLIYRFFKLPHSNLDNIDNIYILKSIVYPKRLYNYKTIKKSSKIVIEHIGELSIEPVRGQNRRYLSFASWFNENDEYDSIKRVYKKYEESSNRLLIIRQYISFTFGLLNLADYNFYLGRRLDSQYRQRRLKNHFTTMYHEFKISKFNKIV